MMLGPQHPWVISDLAPVYILRFPEHFEPSEVDALYSALNNWWRRVDSHMVWVVDYTDCHQSSAWTERAEAYRHYISVSKPFMDRYMDGSAIVVRDEMMKMAIRAMFVAPRLNTAGRTPVNAEFSFFESCDTAVSWGRRVLARAGKPKAV